MRIFHGQKTSKRPAVNKTALCFEKFEAEGLFVFHIQLDVFCYISGLLITSLMSVTAEEIAEMYKSRWAIESFFRWVKQNLNVPVLFGTTENAVFNQLFAALIAYVLLKFLHTQGGKGTYCKPLSFAGFLRLLIWDALPVEWRLEIRETLEWQQRLVTGSLYNFG